MINTMFLQSLEINLQNDSSHGFGKLKVRCLDEEKKTRFGSRSFEGVTQERLNGGEDFCQVPLPCPVV